MLKVDPSKNQNQRKLLMKAASIAVAGGVAAASYHYYVKTTADCPIPPCKWIYVLGYPKCVYANNVSKPCP
jgi:hypothetical protein